MLGAALAAGCGQLRYALQAGMGQWEVAQAARPVEAWLNDPATPERLRARLARAQDIRNFATARLGLPDNGSYRRYADLKRPAVVWNVFAAKPDSIQPETWCFPIAGCVPYRGYYDLAAAQEAARELRAAGLETYVGPVAAYSTLGWFDDPLLNTFIYSSDTELARLIFHELAHQLLYVPGDAEFNEGFASAVETIGVALWLDQPGDAAQQALKKTQSDVAVRQRKAVQQLLLAQREKLRELYAIKGLDAAAREERKAALIAALRADYERMKTEGGFDRRYDAYFAGPLNNAQLASFAVYARWDKAFERLHAAAGGLPAFYARARELAALDTAQRSAQLAALDDADAPRRQDTR